MKVTQPYFIITENTNWQGQFETEQAARNHIEQYNKGVQGKILKVVVVDDVEGQQKVAE